MESKDIMKNILALSAIFVLVVSLLTSEAFAQKEDSTTYGNLSIDGDFFTILGDQFELLQISGEIEDPKSGVRVNIELVKPDGGIDKIETIPNSEGFYTTTLFLDQNWEEGIYTINAMYIENNLGTVTFEIAEVSPTVINISSIIGKIEIEYEEYTKSEGKPLNVKVTGKIFDYVDETEIAFLVLWPNDETREFSVFAERTGDLKARIPIHDDYPTGVYEVNAIYDNEFFGKESFVLEKAEAKKLIPAWIKNNAKWWAEGNIGESDFVGGIQHLIKEKIIDIPDLPEQASDTALQKVPDWVKNNAGWWADGQIGEGEFVNGLKYLVEKGIIRV